jgi:hypothetical protein
MGSRPVSWWFLLIMGEIWLKIQKFYGIINNNSQYKIKLKEVNMKRKAAIFVSILIAVIIANTGCKALDTTAQDNLVLEVFNGIENENYDAIDGYFFDEIKTQDYYDALAAISDYIEGTAVSSKKTGFYYQSTTRNGVQTNTLDLSYNIETSVERYVVSANLVETSEGVWEIYGFNVTRAEELKGNGAIINFDDIDVVQLMLLIYSAACIALIITSIVLCAKAKIRLKALWIIIILCQAGLTLTRTAYSVSYSWQFIIVTISNLRKFINGDTILTVLVPLGAILFLCLRKNLIQSAALREQQRAMNTIPPAPIPLPTEPSASSENAPSADESKPAEDESKPEE